MRETPRLRAMLAAAASIAGCANAVEPASFQPGSIVSLPAIPSHATGGIADGFSGKSLLVLPDSSAIVFVDCAADGSQDVGNPIEAGGQLRFALITDIDGDSLPDIVTTSPTTGRANIIRQVSPGAFALGAVLPIGQLPFIPAATDLSGDGLPELIVPLRGEAKVALLPNLGDGLFGAGTRITTGSAPDSVGLTDFNSDGVIDLAVTCAGSAAINIHLGQQGSGGVTFGPPAVSLPTGSSPSGLVVRDFDGDGFLDLATANTGSASVSVFYSDGTGGFVDAGFLFAGTAAQSIAAADIDQNGLPDLIVTNPSVQTITILQAKADRTFSRSTVQIPFRPSRLTVVNANADGRPDLIVTSQTAAQSIVLLNTTSAAPCPGDVSGDLRVNLQDLNLVLANFGTDATRGDANGDGKVTLADLNIVLANFGSICAES